MNISNGRNNGGVNGRGFSEYNMGAPRTENNGKNRISCSDSAMDRAELMHKIQSLCFAKTETELYLDGHPEAAPALEYYKELVRRIAAVTEEYEAKYGPITASGVNGDSWSWVEGRWPWQYEMEEDL